MMMQRTNTARRPPSKLLEEDDKALKVTGQAAKKIEKL
jgi:hypothetical protein